MHIFKVYDKIYTLASFVPKNVYIFYFKFYDADTDMWNVLPNPLFVYVLWTSYAIINLNVIVKAIDKSFYCFYIHLNQWVDSFNQGYQNQDPT